MSESKIRHALNVLFDNNTNVFWHDEEGEFSTTVESLSMPGIELIMLDQEPALKLKLAIERGDASTKRLFYSNKPEPVPAEDWLLDIRLRSKAFHADNASILLDELGLASQSMRAHLKQRMRFLKSRERIDRLRRWIDPEDDEQALDEKMISVLVRADRVDLLSVLQRLYASLIAHGEIDLKAEPKAWADIEGNDLAPSFWTWVRREVGYSEVKPGFRDLLGFVLLTDLARSMSNGFPQQLNHFVIKNPALAANATVMADRWRADVNHFPAYDELSSKLAADLQLDSLLNNLPAEALLDAKTFEAIDKQIIRDLRDRILKNEAPSAESLREILKRRRDAHWASPLVAEHNEISRALAACYDALEAAFGFLDLRQRYDAGFSFPDAAAAFMNYESETHKFDHYYRHFHRACDGVEPMGWTILQKLQERIEEIYSGWFVPQLGAAWSKVLEGDQGLLSAWKIPGVINQQDFYTRRVRPLFESGTKRVFVVISDAMRYEVAAELTGEFNRRNRFKAQIGTMLGVLPSYTTLGMAALLPHDALAYKQNANLDVLADGLPTVTTEHRAAVLARYNGTAIKADDLLQMGKEKGREFVRPWQLVYVYHDRIDMIGDKQGSEGKTFEAAEAAIRDLNDLTRFIVNSLNASTILITADHGFMYQESHLEEVDRSALDEKPAGILKAKKRYVLGTELGASKKAWCGSTAITAGTTVGEGSLDFWVPKGASRFHFAGGARFVHGSAMPQEIVVPVITVREGDSEKTKTRPVEISWLGASNKVVTNKQRFEFIQTEPVSERVQPRTLLISLRDGEGAISDEQLLTFDSASQLMDERKRSVILTIRAGDYDRTKDYFLVGRDVESKVDILRQPFRVDLAISNDF